MPGESVTIFIRGGGTAAVLLPEKDYDLTFTWGTRWHDEEKRFQNANYQKIHLPKLSVQRAINFLITTQPDGSVDIIQQAGAQFLPR